MTNEQSDQQQQQSQGRKGSSARLIILVLFLIVVGAGCIFEFAFARPQFQSAWEKIKTVDSSSKSGEQTSEDIQELMGREPAAIDETLHDDCIVHTYRWPSGLLVKSHFIHVVFTKLKPGLVETKPELEGKLFYLSASADMPLDPDNNFPKEIETIVMNMNPPGISIGGGGGAQRPPAPPSGDNDEDQGDDEEAAGETSAEESGEQESAEGDGDSSDETTADDDAAEEPADKDADKDAGKDADKDAGDDQSADESSEDKGDGGQ